MIVRLSRSAAGQTLAGFVLAAIAMATWQQGRAEAISGFNSNAPVNYAADRIELLDRQKRVILSGSVDISQGDLRLRAARTTVSYTNEGSLRIQRIDAAGGVQVVRGSETASGDVAVYDFNRRVITMAGHVTLRRGADILNGGRLVYDLNSGIASVTGQGGPSRGGRVSGSFTAPAKN